MHARRPPRRAGLCSGRALLATTLVLLVVPGLRAESGTSNATRRAPAAVSVGQAVPAPPVADQADVLYAGREDPAQARRAIEIWRDRLSDDARAFEAAWKMARACYWLGANGPDDQDTRKRVLQDGMAAARQAIAIEPQRADGHYWLAANMGALAESHGLSQGLRYRGAIRDALETVLTIDPAYLQGSADRALGRWYYKVPRLFGGNKRRSEEHLRRALTYNPDSIITRVFLAETLLSLDRPAEARQQLEAALSAPLDPDWIPEDRRFKVQAEALLSRIMQ